MIYVHVGWGIWGAVVLDGRLRRGHTGSAGELAHVRVRGADGPVCHCGRRGCLKSVASGYALMRDLSVAHAGLDLDGVLNLVENGDPGACRALADAGGEIGSVLAALCTTLNPEAVVIGGPLARTPLVDGARERIDLEMVSTVGPVGVLAAALGELGGALGAATLVVRGGDMARDHVDIR